MKSMELDPDEYCEGCEKCPPSGYWRCPECDAEWFDDMEKEPEP